jgi:hypothetical protein
MAYHKNNTKMKKIAQTTARHSLAYQLYLAFVLLLDRLTYATMTTRPSSSSWVNTTPNPNVLQLVCNWKGRLLDGLLQNRG